MSMGRLLLTAIEEDLSAIIFRPHREVNPVGGAALLLDQFVEHPAVFISRIEQQTSIPDHLLRPQTPDIYGAARQMIAPLRTSALLIYLLTPKPARNDQRDFPS